MAFDVDSFRKKARAAGYSDDEINNEINASISSSTFTKASPFTKGPEGYQLSTIEQIKKDVGNDWWHLPAAVAAFGAALYGGKKLFGDTPPPPPPPLPPGSQIEPTFNQPVAPPQSGTNISLQESLNRQAASKPAGASGQITPEIQTPEQIRIAKQKLATQSLQQAVAPNTAPVGVPPNTQSIADTPGIQQAAPSALPEVKAPTPTPEPPVVKSTPVETAANIIAGETPTQAALTNVAQKVEELTPKVTGSVAPPMAGPSQELTGPVRPDIRDGKLITGTGRELPIGKGKVTTRTPSTFATAADVPYGTTFYPEGTYVDLLRQNIGQDAFTKEFASGQRPLPTTYEEAQKISKEINAKLNKLTYEQLKAAGIEPERAPGIMDKYSKQAKKVTVNGVQGTLIKNENAQLGKATPGMLGALGLNALGAAGIADQWKSGDKSGAGYNAVTQILSNLSRGGGIGSALMTPSNLEPGTLPQDKVQALTVGGGRGVAPPSAYNQASWEERDKYEKWLKSQKK